MTTIDSSVNERLADIIVYVLFKFPDGGLGETKLMKLLYFIDADHYEKYGQTLSGVDYYKNHYGPTPDFSVYQQVCQELGDYIERQKKEAEGQRRTTVRLINNDYQTNLSLEKQTLIEAVIKRYGYLPTKDIVFISHLEPTYTGGGDLKSLIDFSLVHHRQDNVLADTNRQPETIDLTKEMDTDKLQKLNDRLAK